MKTNEIKITLYFLYSTPSYLVEDWSSFNSCLEMTSLNMAEETIAYMEKFYTDIRRTLLFKTIPYPKAIAWNYSILLGTSLSLDLLKMSLVW